jgi:Protein of unknown function (DUF3592)
MGTMDEAPRNRMDRATDRLVALGRNLRARSLDLLHHPVRILIGGICILLLAFALPLLIGGGARLNSSWMDWRHDRAVGRDWVRSTATVQQVRERDGLQLRLTYRDENGDRHRAEVLVVESGSVWVDSRLPIRYDPHHPTRVDLINVAEARPLGSALVAGASVGAGLAALILALGVWRKRRVLEESSRPFRVLRVTLALSAVVLALGIAAWAVGTVNLRGWTGVADRLGHQFSVVFGDMLGVTVPLVAFAIGCLLTAWLARHRHHETHEGVLSSAHRLIDRAAGYVPSPEDLQVVGEDGGDAADAAAVAAGESEDSEDSDGAVRTGR